MNMLTTSVAINVPNILYAVITLAIIHLTALSIYRVTLHPLAKFPGPILSSISKISIFFQTRTKSRHLIQLKEHQTYGPVVRIAPDTLSFSSPAALQQIYQTSQRGNQLRKASWYEIIDAPTGAFSLHTEISRRKHATHRRILDQAFSASAVRTYEGPIHDAVEVFKKVLTSNTKQSWSPPRDMKEYASWFAYDVMGALVFGRRFECMTQETHRSVPNIMMASSALTYMAGYLPFQPIVRRIICSPMLMNILGGDLGRDEHAYVQYATDCMTARLNEEQSMVGNGEGAGSTTSHKDMMHYIIKASKLGSGSRDCLNRGELDADASLLIAAGSDTTALTMAALFFYLTLPESRHRLQKLQVEIRDIDKFPASTSINITSATALPYLRACIDEALRLAPAVPTHLPRTVVTQPGIHIDGHFVPAGTTVGASAYVLHHDEEVFPRSWEFNPERWLFDAHLTQDEHRKKAEQIRRAKQSFIPFSLGSRGCVGRDLAYREMSYCLAHLIYHFDFRRAVCSPQLDNFEDGGRSTKGPKSGGPRDQGNEYVLYDCFLADRIGPQIEFREVRWQGLA